jgi:hypothetical protein
VEVIMARYSGKTEHSGPKKGSGAYYGRKADAKADSNHARRVNDKITIEDSLDDLVLAD